MKLHVAASNNRYVICRLAWKPQDIMGLTEKDIRILKIRGFLKLVEVLEEYSTEQVAKERLKHLLNQKTRYKN